MEKKIWKEFLEYSKVTETEEVNTTGNWFERTEANCRAIKLPPTSNELNERNTS